MDGREISAKSSGEGVPRGSTCGLTLLFLVVPALPLLKSLLYVKVSFAPKSCVR